MTEKIFRTLVSKAIKAPSGHNTQPWKFRLIDDCSIELIPDFEKQLPSVDPYNREIFISMGCAAQNLNIAANEAGFEASFSVSDVNCIVRLEKRADLSLSPLTEAIDRRQTNRGLYNGKTVSRPIVKNLEDCEAKLYANGSPEFNETARSIMQGNVVQMGNPCFKDELKDWIRYNRTDTDNSRDGLSYAAFGAPNMPRFVSEHVMSAMLNAKTQNKADRKKIASSSHFAVFTGDNSIQSWTHVGFQLEKFLLTAANAGIACAFLNQSCEVTEIADLLKQRLKLDKRPQLILRIGYAAPAAYSLRRPISSFIIEQH